MRTTSWVMAAATVVMGVSAHGNITSPPARQPGPAMLLACGDSAVASVVADGTTPLEDVVSPLPTCQLDLCRGAKFADNTGNVQKYKAGQKVRMLAQITIPHGGPMNVSIVNVATNQVIGAPLIQFATYADETLAKLPANNSDFTVKMPSNLAGQCAQAGQCTLQWFWVGTKAQQTYESCVDFTMP